MNRDARLFVGATCEPVFFLLMILFSGCASRVSSGVPWTHPELLYLQDKPYTHLYVEVDRMEGADFPGYLMDELRAFLGKCCLKPDGIDVVVNTPIPLSKFDGFPLSAVSILCIDGPIDHDGRQPAYLHLFVYDGKTVFKQAIRNTRFAFSGAPTIFWNVDFARSFSDATKIHILRHEMGHLLGLCRNTIHCDGTHCRNHECLMYKQPDWLSQLGGMTHSYFREHSLCADCEQDLTLSRQAPHEGVLSFIGPFLIRRADEYYVASLPGYDMIIGIPTLDEFDWRNALHQAKKTVGHTVRNALDKGQSLHTAHAGVWISLYDRLATETSSERLEQDITVLKRVNDPSPNVSRMASKMLKNRQDSLSAPVR